MSLFPTENDGWVRFTETVWPNTRIGRQKHRKIARAQMPLNGRYVLHVYLLDGCRSVWNTNTASRCLRRFYRINLCASTACKLRTVKSLWPYYAHTGFWSIVSGLQCGPKILAELSLVAFSCFLPGDFGYPAEFLTPACGYRSLLLSIVIGSLSSLPSF